jgi:hypothetical protein
VNLKALSMCGCKRIEPAACWSGVNYHDNRPLPAHSRAGVSHVLLQLVAALRKRVVN